MGVREGGAYSNFLNLIKEHGYNKDNYIVIGQVTALSPLTIQLDNFSITQDQFTIAERLTEHTRDITIDATGVSGVTDWDVPDAPHHDHNLLPFQVTAGTLTIKNPLSVNDTVLVLIDGDSFVVVDRVVTL